MKLSAKLLTLAILVVPAVPALSAANAAAPGPTTVARYTFDKGAPSGVVAENSGRGVRLKVRTVHGGAVRFVARNGGRYVGFPAHCAATAIACPRALLEGADDADLDPGTRQFRYGASVYLQKWQIDGSANIMQKGVVDAESQWKLQLGAKLGKAQCVVVGRGSSQPYIAKSDISVADGNWHRLMCLRTSSVLSVFVDGRRRGTVAVPPALHISNDSPLRVGGPNFAAASDMFAGYLDNAFVALG